MKPCLYAACDAPAVTTRGPWTFCLRHAHAHDDLEREALEGQDIAWSASRERLPRWTFQPGHGTSAAARRHHRAGEPLCPACWWWQHWHVTDRYAREQAHARAA